MYQLCVPNFKSTKYFVGSDNLEKDINKVIKVPVFHYVLFYFYSIIMFASKEADYGKMKHLLKVPKIKGQKGG